MLPLAGGIYLGWAIGANDAANVFGTAVASHMVRFRNAAAIACVFIVLGALAGGGAGVATLGGLVEQNAASAVIVAISAGTTVTCMSLLRLPVSGSQAVVGAILGLGLSRGGGHIYWPGLVKVLACWLTTPISGIAAAILIYSLMSRLLDRLHPNIIYRSVGLRIGLIVAGAYGAYAMGANNLGNVVGVFADAGLLAGQRGALAAIGGVSIALGVATFGRRVMMTVGSGLVPLDAASALVVVLAQAATVHFYSLVGVPVSTAQAVVGAVVGIGLLKGSRTVNLATLRNIIFGWAGSPLIAGAGCFAAARFLL